MVFFLSVAAACAVTNLPTVVVEAARIDSFSVLETPVHAETLSHGELVRSGARSLPDALAGRPGLFLVHVGGANPALAQIAAGGYGENGFGRLAMEVDGERMNGPDLMAPNAAGVPLGGVDRVDVLHGPQNVLYGDGASAGAVVVSADGEPRDPPHYAEIGAGSHGTLHAAAGTRDGDEALGLRWWADGSWDSSSGWRDRSGYDSWAARGGLRKDFANGAFLKISAHWSDAQYDLPGPLSERDAARHPRRSTYDDRARRRAYGFSLSGEGVLDAENSLLWTAGVSERVNHFANGDFTPPGGVRQRYARVAENDAWAFRFSPRWENSAPAFGCERKSAVGADFRWNRLHGKAYESYPDWGFSSYSKDAFGRTTGGIFAREELFVTDGVSFVAGARGERAWNDNGSVADGGRLDDLAAYEGAVNWRPSEEAKVFARMTRFYRNPFLDEYRWLGGVPRGTAAPEDGWCAETGADWDLACGWFVSAALRHVETENEIYYDPFAWSNENLSDRTRRGVADLSVAWEREKMVSVRVGWCGAIAELAEGENEGKRIPSVPSQQADVAARAWIRDTLSVSGGCRLLGPRYAISDVENANGKFGTDLIFRCGVRWEPEAEPLAGFSFAFACENLFDRRYCDYAVASVTGGGTACYPAQGRSFAFTVRREF